MKKKAQLLLFLLFTVFSCSKSSDSKIEQNQGQSDFFKNMQENAYHPMAIAFQGENNQYASAYIIGGYKDGKWYKQSSFALMVNNKAVKRDDFGAQSSLNGSVVVTDILQGAEDFIFYDTNKIIARSPAGKPQFSIDGYGNEIMEFQFKPFSDSLPVLIGVNASWNAIPRPVGDIPAAGMIALDLDGDGTKDQLNIFNSVLAEKDNLPTGQLKKITVRMNGQTFPVCELELDGIYASQYQLFFMDLNNDNKLEIVSVLTGHNISVQVFELQGSKAVEVLSYYVGD